MSDPGFIHLHVHSSYSLLEGALSIGKLADLVKADAQPAIALTDTGNLFGALEFSEKMSGSGIQPIAGVSLALDLPDPPGPRGAIRPKRPRIVLLAQSEPGWRNLMKLVSRAFLETASEDEPRILVDWLAEASDGLIALTGGPAGPLDKALVSGHPELAAERLDLLASLFRDRLYVEVQRHETDAERLAEAGLLELAYAKGVPLVAANEPFFASQTDYEAHDALLCIAEGRLVAEGDRRRLTAEHRFKTRKEMLELFADLPEATANTVEIARRCAYRVRTVKPILPRFTSGGGHGDPLAEEAAELERQAREGLAQRLAKHGPAPGLDVKVYEERLAYELSVITKMKFPGYFLIVSDFIKWAKAHDIPVGPGRGSGAGSLVAYSLQITDLDPLRFGLLFERFLNPDRVSMPDFDVDFCQERRDEVIHYVQERYGRAQVAQIITFGTLQARGVLRDVGRVLEMPYGQVDKLCKLVPQNPANPVTLKQAIEDEPRLQATRDQEEVVKRAFDIAVRLEGLNRHASTHAAGIVIGDRQLHELVPLYRDPKSDMPVTQYNMKWVEQAGLVKFDFLGLKTLTTIDKAVKLVHQRGIELDISKIPLDDPKTYAMLGKGETVGVFQVESAGMRRALVDMKADRVEDLIALVALYRPGPMANIPVYCDCKHGRAQPDYLHPMLEPYLKETFGVIIYQEQVMQIAQAMAGYSLGEADLLRRAMGKKIRAEMEKQRERFVSGAAGRGIEKAQADTIFDLLAKFADYGFNKSHAAAYALVAYQTAWLKANYPTEFLAASMTLDMGNTDKLAEFRQEAQRLGIEVVPPNINLSAREFAVKDGKIIYAMAAIKGVGGAAVEALVAARGERAFRDFSDFACRLPVKLVNKRTLESLMAAGCFDVLEKNRARAFAAIDSIVAEAQRVEANAQSGQNDMFGSGPSAAALPIPDVAPWLPSERLQREYDTIGFFLTGHPLDDYADALKKMRVQAFSDFARAVRSGAAAGRLAATVVSKQERRTKSGTRMGIVGLSDPSGHYEAVIFSEGLAHFRDLLEPGTPLLMMVAAELNGEDVRVRINSCERLDPVTARHQKGLRIFLRSPEPIEGIARRLSDGKAGEAGSGDVSLILLMEDAKAEVEVSLPGKYPVSPQIAGAIKAIPGVVAVEAA
ncbi:DNA polymerase III subunit alpha [Xanthobacter dioxanivorans]|uniref:DNA polymerase III subunit alpha n=1 Tax=Xanthobacter dioxanivorans TaxID=2528964 RepID=A0A974PKN0_9HYPH|nr:DNA polymerase III subunit alpha [Xanthobacter dioxanivorans]QRG05340.1 DNA polymerase III subunit alpha [Xanthobacter dioxanivorans]